jgi:hypothetical protein
VWGGTGLAITRDCADPELAWAFAEFLYLEPGELGKRFRESNILPPVRDAWNLPEFDEPQPFFSGQAVGRLYAELAPETPDEYVHAYTGLAQAKVNEAYMAASEHFRRHGERGLRRQRHRQNERRALGAARHVDPPPHGAGALVKPAQPETARLGQRALPDAATVDWASACCSPKPARSIASPAASAPSANRSWSSLSSPSTINSTARSASARVSRSA